MKSGFQAAVELMFSANGRRDSEHGPASLAFEIETRDGKHESERLTSQGQGYFEGMDSPSGGMGHSRSSQCPKYLQAHGAGQRTATSRQQSTTAQQIGSLTAQPSPVNMYAQSFSSTLPLTSSMSSVLISQCCSRS